MKSHSWLILLVVLCTTQALAKPPSTTQKDVEEIPSTKATNILKNSAVSEDSRYCLIEVEEVVGFSVLSSDYVLIGFLCQSSNF